MFAGPRPASACPLPGRTASQWPDEAKHPSLQGYRKAMEAYAAACRALGNRWVDGPAACTTQFPSGPRPEAARLPHGAPPCGAARRLLRLLALSLGLPAEFFDPFFTHPMLFLRPLYYHAVRSSPTDGVFGCGAHRSAAAEEAWLKRLRPKALVSSL